MYLYIKGKHRTHCPTCLGWSEQRTLCPTWVPVPGFQPLSYRVTTNFESAHVSTLTSIAIYNLVPLARKETNYIYWNLLYMLKDNEFEGAAKSFQAKHSKIARITNKTEKSWCWAGAKALQQLLCRSLPPAAYAADEFFGRVFFFATSGPVSLVLGGLRELGMLLL